jgi:hypothetical protein
MSSSVVVDIQKIRITVSVLDTAHIAIKSSVFLLHRSCHDFSITIMMQTLGVLASSHVLLLIAHVVKPMRCSEFLTNTWMNFVANTIRVSIDMILQFFSLTNSTSTLSFSIR